MRNLRINCIDFKTAFELSSYETAAYLDTETGAVILVEDYLVAQLEELLTGEDSESVLQTQTDLTHLVMLKPRKLIQILR